MRFNLFLRIKGPSRVLPINYQYPLHSWIYRVIQQSDATFSQFLHEEGYSTKQDTTGAMGDDHRGGPARPGRGPRFKLFTFSPLIGKPFRIFKEEQRIAFYGNGICLGVSFWLPEAAEHFVRGLFMGQSFRLGDRISQIELEVVRIETMLRPLFSKVMQYRTVSPVVVSVRVPDRKHPQYLAPNDERYAAQLLKNLLHKAEAARLNVSPLGVVSESTVNKNVGSDSNLSEKWQLTGGDTFRKKGILIKQHTPMQNKIIGYNFDFELVAPPIVQQLAYYAGLGEDNSMGFGFVEIRTEER